MIHQPDFASRLRLTLLACFAFAITLSFISAASFAQDVPFDAADVQSVMNDQPQEPGEPGEVAPPQGIDLLSLIYSGGNFMIPIALMSVLVVALAAERFLSLRRNRILPQDLVVELRELADPIDRFNPGVAYQACQDNPSPAGRVVSAMLLRTGQPLGEIQQTAVETVQREADIYASPIRWLNLAAAATPLMGLLGTVWGMIVAFHESTTLTPDRSRSEQLSEGIYTALVTTLAGLVVAIPAAILAQYLENRVIRLFHHIEQLAFDIAPGLQRFQGRRRLNPDGSLQPMQALPGVKPASDPAPKPPPPPTTSPRTEAPAR